MPAQPRLRARDAAAFAVLGLAIAVPLLARPAAFLTPAFATLAWPVAVSAALGAVLAVLSAIDLSSRRLPDALTLPLAAAGIGLAWSRDPGLVPWHLGSAALGYAALWGVARIYVVLRDRPGLGLGDAKLLAAAGAWLGLDGLPSVVLVASLAALALVLAARSLGRTMTMATAIPFGPFLALGFWVVWLYGPLA